MSATAQSLNLVKGQNLNLTKDHSDLKVLNVGMGWSPSGNSANWDLDAFAVCLDANNKCVNWPENVLFFNSPKVDGKLAIHGGSISHSGDNLTGEGEGDDETLVLKLGSIPASVEKVLLCANIYDAKTRQQNFGQVKDSYIRAYNGDTNEEYARYDLREDFSTATAVIFAEVYRNGGEWKFRALGEGKQGDINEIAAAY
jgi:tellurium resistance protein TerD